MRWRIKGTHLLVTFICELDAMVWDHLVNLAVLVALGLGMPYEDYQTGLDHLCLIEQVLERELRNRGEVRHRNESVYVLRSCSVFGLLTIPSHT